MKEVIYNILSSFKNNDEGYSSKKLTAFVIIILVIVTHVKWLAIGNLTQLEMVLTIDYSFIATLFGMTIYHTTKVGKTKDTTLDEIKKEA